MRRATALFAGAFVALAATFAFPVAVNAKTGESTAVSTNTYKKSLNWEKYDYSSNAGVDSGKSTTVTIVTTNADEGSISVYGEFAYGSEYVAAYPDECAEMIASGMEDPRGQVSLYFAAYGSFSKGDTISFSFPEAIVLTDNYSSSYYNWATTSLDGKEITLVATADTNMCTYNIFGNMATATSQNAIFWEEPLENKLSAAATSSDKKVVEYTGDFALSQDTMKYLKDHPDITLKYNVMINGEKKTAVLGGGNVVVDEKIKWYGIEYLVAHYGNGSVSNAAAGSGEYIIQKGDTLSKIAKKLGTTVKALAAKNNISNVNVIHAGRKLVY